MAHETTRIPPGGPAPQPLNRFQQAMGRWERIHPYNAGHVVRVRGPLHGERLRESIVRQCQACGVGELVLNDRKSEFHYRPLEPLSLDFVETSIENRGALDPRFARELNRPFPIEPHHPLRWFAIRQDEEDMWTLAVVYHHLASDAHGVMVLLARVLRDYFGETLAEGTPPLTTHTLPFRRSRSIVTELLAMPGSLARMAYSYFALRRAHRLHERRDGGESTSVVTQDMPAGVAPILAARCKRARAGVNDAYMAALTVALAEHTPRRRAHRRRRKLALASAVSLRSWAREDLSGCFGTYVGHSIVLVHDPDAGFESVLEEIARQTDVHKRQRRAADIAWPLVFAKYLWPLLGIPDATASYRKLYPLCAGVSSVRIDSNVFGGVAPRIIDYARICPPGPAMPMVLAPTTFHDRLCLSLVFRDAALTHGEANALIRRVSELLAGFAGFEAMEAEISAPRSSVVFHGARTVEPVRVPE